MEPAKAPIKNTITIVATYNGKKFAAWFDVDIKWLPLSPTTEDVCIMPHEVNEILICNDYAILRHTMPPSIDVTDEAEEELKNG